MEVDRHRDHILKVLARGWGMGAMGVTADGSRVSLGMMKMF